jgi:hypothetical protein
MLQSDDYSIIRTLAMMLIVTREQIPIGAATVFLILLVLRSRIAISYKMLACSPTLRRSHISSRLNTHSFTHTTHLSCGETESRRQLPDRMATLFPSMASILFKIPLTNFFRNHLYLSIHAFVLLSCFLTTTTGRSHPDPNDGHHDIQPLTLGRLVLVAPHAVARVVPVRACSGVHASSTGCRRVGGGGWVG